MSNKDTRYGFTHNLYRALVENKVNTFMDVQLVGKVIDSLFDIIQRSKIAVVVYSERFAASDWCLRELEMILQRVEDKEMLVVPIFYKVDVHELKKLTGETAKYLNAHTEEHDETTVQKWKDIVTDLGSISGISYKDRYENDFIVEVIEVIKGKVEEWEKTCIPKPNTKDVMGCPTFEITCQGTEEFMEELGSVYSVDVHPTKPWVLLGSSYGIWIWNYETRGIEKSFKVDNNYLTLRVNSAKFIPEKHWIVAGGSSNFVYVFDYNTSERLKEFKAHNKKIRRVAVHPTLSYVLTASEDKLVKLWNWENDWACQETFKGHSSEVNDIVFNPKDPHSFASASSDFLKIWRIDSRVPEFTSDKYASMIQRVEYFVGNGDMLYILSGEKIWHCGSKTLVQSLEHNASSIVATFVHPELPIILTSCYFEKNIRIWSKNTYQLLHVWDCDFEDIYSFGFIKATKEVVIGFEEGMVVVKFAFAE